MELLQIVMLAIIVIIIATITLAVLSYGAFKVRESRSPRGRMADDSGTESLFFERIRLVGESEADIR